MKKSGLFLGLWDYCHRIPCRPTRPRPTRTRVSGVGDEVNPCSRTAPCKTFAGVKSTAWIRVVTAPLTITKSITIDCGGTFGSVLNSGGINGFNINDSASGSPGRVNRPVRGIRLASYSGKDDLRSGGHRQVAERHVYALHLQDENPTARLHPRKVSCPA
jgi:hypothetical protein